MRILPYCCPTCHFQITVISKRVKLETWDCAQMKDLSTSYRLAISYDLLHGYLGRQIPKTMGCVFFFSIRIVSFWSAKRKESFWNSWTSRAHICEQNRLHLIFVLSYFFPAGVRSSWHGSKHDCGGSNFEKGGKLVTLQPSPGDTRFHSFIQMTQMPIQYCQIL